MNDQPTNNDQITELLLAQSAEELYESAPCGYLLTTIDGLIIKVNRTLAEWLGYERDELTHRKQFVELLTVGGRIFYETHFSLLLLVQNTVDEIALDFVRKDGRVLPTLINGRQQRNEAKQPILNSFTIFNASERRMYERELLAARDLLRTTLGSIGDAVIATDAEGRITFMNPVADRLSGWPANAAVGRPIEEVLTLLNEETGAPVKNPIFDATRKRATVGLTNHTILISRDGQRIPIDDSASPIRDANGEVIGGVLVFRDISQRRKAELELKKAHEQLEERADELRRSNDDLSKFAYVASHDLRSPLNTIAQYAQLLERNYGTELAEGKELLHQLSDAAKRMSHLIEDLLSYAHVSEALPASAPVDSEWQFNIALQNLRSAIRDSGAVITHDVLPQVPVDPTSLLQLFQNLTGNAIQYRTENAPVIHVSCREQHDLWLFSCRDNGIGVPPEFRAQIFEPFKRLHGSECPGSGLGLAVCKRIVERFNGSIWVESEVNEGSTFLFTLPRST